MCAGWRAPTSWSFTVSRALCSCLPVWLSVAAERPFAKSSRACAAHASAHESKAADNLEQKYTPPCSLDIPQAPNVMPSWQAMAVVNRQGKRNLICLHLYEKFGDVMCGKTRHMTDQICHDQEANTARQTICLHPRTICSFESPFCPAGSCRGWQQGRHSPTG